MFHDNRRVVPNLDTFLALFCLGTESKHIGQRIVFPVSNEYFGQNSQLLDKFVKGIFLSDDCPYRTPTIGKQNEIGINFIRVIQFPDFSNKTVIKFVF